MANLQAKALQTLYNDATLIQDVIVAAKAVATDLAGNSNDKVRDDYLLIEVNKAMRLIEAVKALDNISLPK